MSLPTSDLHNPTVCLGNRYLKSITNESNYQNKKYAAIEFNTITMPIGSSARALSSNDNISNINNSMNKNSNDSSSNTNNNNDNNNDAISKYNSDDDKNRSNNNLNSNSKKYNRSCSSSNSKNQSSSNNNIISANNDDDDDDNNNQNNNNNGDLASVDSSDTYASCQTHPFLSQGDLTDNPMDTSFAFEDFNMDDLYLNSLEKKRTTSLAGTRAPIAIGGSVEIDSNTGIGPNIKGQMKKSASGDASLHSFSPGTAEGILKTFQSFEIGTRLEDRGSHISLNETVPKHRKNRFQQSSLNKLKMPRVDILTPKKVSQDNLNEKSISSSSPIHTKKYRRASFMPTKSLASATKLINQHLFGIQHMGSKGKTEDKVSLSQDSIETTPNVEIHRRSKSILKNKSESSKILMDPESERLLADNMSGASASENGSVSKS